MKVSVIIPTRNGGQYLRQLFSRLREQSVKPVQVLVIDSSSSDETLRICEESSAEILGIRSEAFDHGGTRNLAASRAKGNILVFLTQDAILRGSDCIKNLIRPLDDPQVAGSYGRQVAREDATPVEKFVRDFNYPLQTIVKSMENLEKLGTKTFFFSNVCSAIKKDVLNEVGGFPEKTIMNEDMYLAAKLVQKGYKIVYQPNAVVYHSHNYSLVSQFQRYFDIGVFYNRNKWIKELSNPEREGVKYLKEEFMFLVKNNQWNWVPYASLENMSRFVGYRVGLLEKSIPVWLKKQMSLNTNYWNYKEKDLDNKKGRVSDAEKT